MDVIYLAADQCGDCYDPKAHRDVLISLGVAIGNEREVGSSSPEGQELIEKYSIKTLPTMIVGPEASIYPAFESVWQQVGSREADGSHVFRKNSIMVGMTYLNISDGKTISNQ